MTDQHSVLLKNPGGAGFTDPLVLGGGTVHSCSGCGGHKSGSICVRWELGRWIAE